MDTLMPNACKPRTVLQRLTKLKNGRLGGACPPKGTAPPLVDRPSVDAPYPVGINALEHNPQTKIVLKRFWL
jgi:hypothetical protein